MESKSGKRVDRRAFMRGGALTAAGAASVAVLTATDQAEAAEPLKGKQAGYQESDHVRRVYALSRF